jgi:proline iminopeptidase
MKATIRNTDIYFDVAGMQLAPHHPDDFIEKPILFVLHGGPGGDHLRFKLHSLELQETAQMIFIDHRGCGRSKKTKASDYTLENNIEDIEALRKHLGLKEICILGTSYGGMVAQGYAIRYPKHVKKLILVATAPSYHFIEDAKKYLNQHGTPKQIAVCDDLWNGTFKSSKHVSEFFKVMDSLYSIKAKQKGTPVFGKLKTKWSYQALNKGFNDFLRYFNFIPQLKKIRCPTLILAGKDDWICRPEHAKVLAKNIHNASLKIFKQCGHAIAVDAHDKYIKIIHRFLRKD